MKAASDALSDTVLGNQAHNFLDLQALMHFHVNCVARPGCKMLDEQDVCYATNRSVSKRERKEKGGSQVCVIRAGVPGPRNSLKVNDDSIG